MLASPASLRALAPVQESDSVREESSHELSDSESKAAGPELEEARNSSLGLASKDGADSGVFELGLGTVVTAVGVGLIVAGSVDLRSGIFRKQSCAVEWSENCNLDPPRLIFASSILAYSFSLPALIGGALLLNKGGKINRDYRAVRRTQSSWSLAPAHAFRHGAVFHWRLRF